MEKAIKQVSDLVGDSKATVVLAGDFNCPGIDWENRSPGSKVVGISEKLIKITSEHGLEQQQKDPTKLDAILDLFFTNNESLISSIKTVPGVSTADEHEAIVTDLDLRAEITKSVGFSIQIAGNGLFISRKIFHGVCRISLGYHRRRRIKSA